MAKDTGSEAGHQSPSPPSRDLEERHPTLWLEDGNVVLSAQSTIDKTRTLLFRVHRSVLARQSQVFSYMFDLPASGSQRLYDGLGVPRIDLHDSAEDLEETLKVLYNPWYELF